jgi:hypothetical protein
MMKITPQATAQTIARMMHGMNAKEVEETIAIVVSAHFGIADPDDPWFAHFGETVVTTEHSVTPASGKMFCPAGRRT